jgi:hypothetical protein
VTQILGAHGRIRFGRTFLALAILCSALFAREASAALALSPASVTLAAGSRAAVSISGARGQIQAESKNTAVVTVTLSNVTTTGATLTVYGVAAGSTTVYVRDGRTRNLSLPVTVVRPLTVSPTSLSLAVGATSSLTASNYSGALTATSGNSGIATTSVSSNVVTVKGIASGSTIVTVRDSRSTVNVPVTVLTSGTAAARYSLIAWNDLGMHCVDGKDYSVFSILPPFNNLHAQLVNASTGRAVTSGVTLTYLAVADPTGSINTSSSSKTNFWTWVQTVYGVPLASDVGLTGNATPSLAPQPMTLDAGNGWFEASGLPITPYDDRGAKNYYPMVKVVAKDSTGKVLATTSTVLPVSDEITCVACHASPAAGETNPARLAARPAAGWVYATDPEQDWKKNILLLHDEKQAGNAEYLAALLAKGRSPGLYASAVAGKPTLCAACHASNALPGTGVTGISTLTSALHTNHGRVLDPTTLATLDSSSSRNACYLCHPGSVTRCLRGAMGNAINPDGTAAMGCQSCHGNMSKVGSPARVGWLQEPNCQSCHFNGKRTLSAVDAAGNPVVVADARFATNPNVPGAGFSLFRFSKGHGGLQCESCHGSTHAEYPSSHTNDNLQSIALQGYAGTVRECSVCHATPTLTATGGPHGMHTIGARWVSGHEGYVESGGAAQCAYCHGSDYRGSPLAQVKAPRSFTTKSGSTRSYVAGQNVGCYDCHNGPNP